MALLDIFSNLRQPAKTSGKVVGIDIGSSSIKLVELEDRNDVVTLTTYGEVQIGPYADKELGQTVVLQPKQEQTALVDVLRESAVKARQAVFAMPLASSFVTVMEMKARPDEDISSRIRVEARKYIPVPISDVTLDWAEIDTLHPEDTNERRVLLAAIQNEGLERLRTLMRHVNMPSQPSEIECFSAIRGVTDFDDATTAVIDLGAASSKLYIAESGLLHRMHRVRAGGAMCTNRLAKAHDISFQDAELRKRGVHKGDEHYRDIAKVHESCFERALGEFRRVIEEYESLEGTTIKRVVVIGGPVQFVGLPGMITDTLQRDIEIANPFAKVAYPAFMEDLITTIGPSFTTALGAALRNFE
ncbi:MAG: type IV pilus assembly protein PilM [Patescibacteria group bacterium]